MSIRQISESIGSSADGSVTTYIFYATRIGCIHSYKKSSLPMATEQCLILARIRLLKRFREYEMRNLLLARKSGKKLSRAFVSEVVEIGIHSFVWFHGSE